MKCPSKSCSLDSMPTWLVKQHLPVLTPILTKIVNNSLSSGSFPSGLRRAIITPILKKAFLDKNTLGNYRPVSNLPFVGKLIEKVVSVQVSDYLSSNDLSDPYQSAYTRARSTETALACVQNDILRAIDNQQAVFLLMLDLSAAFHFSSPGYLSSYFQSRVHKTKYSLRSDLAITFEVPRAKKKKSGRSCLFCGWASSLEWAAEQCPYCRSYGQVQKQT